MNYYSLFLREVAGYLDEIPFLSFQCCAYIMHPTRFKMLPCVDSSSLPQRHHITQGEWRHLAQGSWLGSSGWNRMHPPCHTPFLPRSELQGQPAGLTAAVTWWATTLCYSFWEVLQRISSIHADLQETRQFPNLSETLWHSYWKSSHLGKGRYKLTSFVTSIHLVSSWCKGR